MSLRKEPLIRCGLGPHHLLPQGEKEERPFQPRGHAAAMASNSQLTIRSVPPIGGGKGNSARSAKCRKQRSPANSADAITKPKPAASPPLPATIPRSVNAATASTAVA